MFRRLRNLSAGCRELLSQPAAWSNLLTIAGAVSISIGAFWLHAAAGFIVAGLAAIAIAVLMHSDEPKDY